MKTLTLILLVISNAALAQYEDYTVDALVTPRQQEMIITVGGENADIQGFTNRSIQLAVDALPARGGTVMLNPGIFELKDAVHLRSHMKLIGSGPSTILKRTSGFRSKLIDDADYGELKLMVEDASGFETGMSVQIWDEPQAGCWDLSIGTITDIEGSILYIDNPLIRDYRAYRGGMVSNAGSGILINKAEHVFVSDVSIDGNRAHHEPVDGCNGGGVAIREAKNVTIDKIHIKDVKGEGITWQITENVTVQNCEIEGCANMGLHPGSGSPGSRILNNNSHHNDVDGLFLCWRVHHSIVQGNQIHHNGGHGICTGHKDSDVVFKDNHIHNNGRDGINFRNENSLNSPHRNTFINNLIENNGQNEQSYGIAIYGSPQQVVIKGNTIRNAGSGNQEAGVFIKKGVPSVTIEENRMSGHKNGNVVEQK